MRMINKRIAALPVIALIFLSACQTTRSSSASKMLRFGFEKGRGYDYEMIISMDQEMMGQKIQMDMTNYYSMVVTEDNGATKNISTTFERFKMNMGIGGMNIEIDSDNPLPDFGNKTGKEAIDKLNGLLGAIKGQKFSMLVNEEGQVLEVKGFETMANTIIDSLGIDEKQKGEMIRKFNQQFNEQSIKDQFARIFNIFPNKEVKVGDTWQKTLTVGGPAAGKYISDYKVKEIEGDMVTVDENTKISSGNDENKVEGTLEGTLIIDSKTGLVVNADQDMNLTTNRNGMTSNIRMITKIKGTAR
jgi:hypothetical protein